MVAGKVDRDEEEYQLWLGVAMGYDAIQIFTFGLWNTHATG